jgi:hypothetical protein
LTTAAQGFATGTALAPAQQPQIQVQQTPALFKQAHRIIDVDVDPPVVVDPPEHQDSSPQTAL